MPGDKCPICGETGAQHIPLSDYFCVSAGYEREKARAETMRKALEKCRDLFADIRGDWTDPRAECREGIEVIRDALAAPASAPGEEKSNG